MALVQVHKIVMEASSKEDQNYMKNMSKNDIHQINGTLIQNLYQSVIKRKNIDFGDIPDSNGDIEKMAYYESTVESLDILDELYSKNNLDKKDINTIRVAISNMKKYRPQFQTGFKMKHEFIMITYNSLCMAIVDATSCLIASYMDYIVSADEQFTTNVNFDKHRGSIALDSLTKFNTYADNNKFGEALEFMIGEQQKNFAGESIVITGAVILILLNIVPIIRELIFAYYHTRVRLSDYLNMQADFLEMNKLAVEVSKRSPAEKKKIVKKQDDVIKKLRRNADKIKINDIDTNDVVKKEQKKEDSLWSLNNIEKQLSKNKLEGASFNII